MKAIQHIEHVKELIKQSKLELTTAVSKTDNKDNKLMIQKAISSFESIYQNLETYQD